MKSRWIPFMLLAVFLPLGGCLFPSAEPGVITQRYLDEGGPNVPNIHDLRCDDGRFALCHYPDEIEINNAPLLEDYDAEVDYSLPYVIFTNYASQRDFHFANHDEDYYVDCKAEPLEVGDACPARPTVPQGN